MSPLRGFVRKVCLFSGSWQVSQELKIKAFRWSQLWGKNAITQEELFPVVPRELLATQWDVCSVSPSSRGQKVGKSNLSASKKTDENHLWGRGPKEQRTWLLGPGRLELEPWLQHLLAVKPWANCLAWIHWLLHKVSRTCNLQSGCERWVYPPLAKRQHAVGTSPALSTRSQMLRRMKSYDLLP